ncbi:uncharacterized protein LOC119310367 [Triticum dicoccoides]|uniref:uncharacterized protein LOC119310367 n=1 Tax=Triticum dicoccoides TaxID=85692 RepID=UPI001891A102|nr:uncharacterized protein LOC119310367 [Triticum dicoccoides]
MVCAQLRRAFLSPSSIVIPPYASISPAPTVRSRQSREEEEGRRCFQVLVERQVAAARWGTSARRPGPTSSSAWRWPQWRSSSPLATSYHPSDLHVHAQIGHAAAPAAYAGETQQQHCAATEAEALDLHKTALMLVLSGLAQAMIAAAADLALAWDGGILGRLFAVVAPLVGAMNVYSICYVVHGVAVVAGGHCAAGYLYLPDFGSYLAIAVLLIVSLVVTLCG